jgi:hypothetical protein
MMLDILNLIDFALAYAVLKAKIIFNGQGKKYKLVGIF